MSSFHKVTALMIGLALLCSVVMGQEGRWTEIRQRLSQITVAALIEDAPPIETEEAEEIDITHEDVITFLAAYPDLANIDLGYLSWLEASAGESIAYEWLNDQLRSRTPRPPWPLTPVPTPEATDNP